MESRAVHLAYEIMAHSGVACPTSATRSSLRLSIVHHHMQSPAEAEHHA